MAEPPTLDATALAVYRAVLLYREHDRGRLAARLDMTAEEVGQVIEELVALAMLRPSWDQPDLVRAVSPEIGLQLLLQREQRESALRQERTEQTRAALSLLSTEYASHEERPSRHDTEILHGMDEIRTRLEALASQCTKEVLSFLPGGALPTAALREGQPLNERAMLRGVRFRNVYLQSITKDRQTYAYVRWVHELGSEVRLSPRLPMRLLIVDGGTAVIPGDPEEPHPTALVLHSPPVLRALQELFEAYWKDATPLEAPSRCGELTELPPQEREVLRMLANGDKDETVARALGISVRTERRMVADLLARTGASSRFELGVKAAKAGWV
ncbi:hypothetical protein SLA_0515 [Streptomyces laurentii]|uniref:HTH luxR-type domain-containing protein n=1 Tax=Streptomyces laurentii TaxID=39478 RepID=A0A160NV60_STRLU|nr:hypothetical protein SLA_0515 [Streptomyces laurentii]